MCVCARALAHYIVPSGDFVRIKGSVGFRNLPGGFQNHSSLLLEVDADRSTMSAAATSLVVVDPDPGYNNVYSVVPTPDGRNEVRAAFRW